jgi:16S rRNA (uracil1498-N3)-methyltransferase
VSDRYFSETPISEDQVLLAGPEAHHLVHVMRAKRGTQVMLFDGSGAEFTARVEQVGRSGVRLAVLSRQAVDRELSRELTLGVALPKGDRQRWLVEKAVELGVRRVVPLVTQRSVAQPGPGALRRLRRTVVEASKQCGRNRLLEISEPQAWTDYVDQTRTVALRLLAQPHGQRTHADRLSVADRPGQVCMAVGPEGGFTGEEVSRAQAAGWQTVDLGPRTLRVETAALVLVSLAAQQTSHWPAGP